MHAISAISHKQPFTYMHICPEDQEDKNNVYTIKKIVKAGSDIQW